jgi:hypothetical protein
MTASRLLKDPQWLKAFADGRPIGVDRKANVLRGYIVAKAGPFKTAGRGEFTGESLDSIVSLMRAARGGLKSRFAHPTLSGDGLGKFLGRSRDPFRDGDLVRADLHFDPSALEMPPEGGSTPLGMYVMNVAETDPAAISSSLVLNTNKIYRLDEKGRAARDASGEELPPIWQPTQLHASDIVDTGEAVDDVMSAQLSSMGLPDAIVRQAAELLDSQFEGAGPEVIRSRSLAWLESYLTWRFGDAASPSGEIERRRRRLRLKQLAAESE